MKKFKIKYVVYGEVEIEANNPEEAERLFEKESSKKDRFDNLDKNANFEVTWSSEIKPGQIKQIAKPIYTMEDHENYLPF